MPFTRRRTTQRRRQNQKQKQRSWHTVPLGNGFCLDVEGGSKAVGARTIAWPCHGQSNQLFRATTRRGLRRSRRGLSRGLRRGLNPGQRLLQAKHSRMFIDPLTFRQMK